MSVRVYVPLTRAELATALAAGRVAGPFRAHAVTDALVTAWPDGDEEELAYAAMAAAAHVSWERRTPGDVPRRYVLAGDVEAVVPVAGEDPTEVEVAQDLQGLPANALPTALLQRLSTVNAQLVTSIATATTPPAPPLECTRALKKLRWERERAAIQREIDRLQAIGARQHGNEIDALWQKKKELLLRIEQLT